MHSLPSTPPLKTRRALLSCYVGNEDLASSKLVEKKD